MRKFLISLLILCASGCGARHVRELEPTVVSLPSGATTEQVGKAVRLALVGRGWDVENEKPGSVDGHLAHEGNVVRVTITYNQSAAAIRYLSGSSQVSDLRNTATPRPTVTLEEPSLNNYQRWVANLALDIPLQLKRTMILD